MMRYQHYWRHSPHVWYLVAIIFAWLLIKTVAFPENDWWDSKPFQEAEDFETNKNYHYLKLQLVWSITYQILSQAATYDYESHLFLFFYLWAQNFKSIQNHFK